MATKASFKLEAAVVAIVLLTVACAPPLVTAVVSFTAAVVLASAWSREAYRSQ